MQHYTLFKTVQKNKQKLFKKRNKLNNDFYSNLFYRFVLFLYDYILKWKFYRI